MNRPTALTIVLSAIAIAQGPPPTVAESVVSPEVSGGRVTFRIFAPKAEKVTLNGDWWKCLAMPPGFSRKFPMAKS